MIFECRMPVCALQSGSSRRSENDAAALVALFKVKEA